MKPLIGITCDYDWELNKAQLYSGYYEGVFHAGGLPFLIPCCEEADAVELIARLDGLILSGGSDVDPKYFGEPPHPQIRNINPCRDSLELAMCREAAVQNLPVLGICRGMQVMNIAMGGDIYQDIHSQWQEGSLINHEQRGPKWFGAHEVMLAQGSVLHTIIGAPSIRTNSFHHQAVRSLGVSLVSVGTTEDGVIEAIESVQQAFFLGVQWHPELMRKCDACMQRLFQAMLDQADKNRK